MSPVLLAILALAAPPSEGMRGTPTVAPVSAPEEASVSVPEKASAERNEASAGKNNEASVSQAEGLASEKAEVTPRKGVELREAVRAALRRWAKPSDSQADAAAHEFLSLYRELQADDQLSRGQRRYFRGKVRMRLMRLSEQIALRVARQKRLAEAHAPEAGDSEDAETMAARADSPGSVAMASPGGAAFGGGAFRTPDYGQQLVELIQTVICPDTWDVNGGLGTIYYWYPGRALVVRQTSEVHGEIAGTLDQLRRAGP